VRGSLYGASNGIVMLAPRTLPDALLQADWQASIGRLHLE